MGKQIKTMGDMLKVSHMFGPEAVKWVELRIAGYEKGEDEEVVAHDTQIMFLLIELSERANAMEGKPI